jgi:probable H4MPT-linked C1 transfer pathway protein
MTAELSDLFEDREHGVQELIDLAAAHLSPLLIYGGRAGFLNDSAITRAADIASANWHATASLVALKLPDGLVVDIGSTTTDLVPVSAGAVEVAGYTDAERLATGELLYTGATRTPVMAICARVPFAGQWRTLMAEHFAVMADVYRLTGALRPDELPQTTADGRGLSLAECRARLARMIGWDAKDAPDRAWDDLAHYVSERQLALICDTAALVLSRCALSPDAPIIGAGSGRFLARSLASRIGRSYRDLDILIDVPSALRAAASEAAPACAVALLAQAQDPLYAAGAAP